MSNVCNRNILLLFLILFFSLIFIQNLLLYIMEKTMFKIWEKKGAYKESTGSAEILCKWQKIVKMIINEIGKI